jgi:hypothetical protein
MRLTKAGPSPDPYVLPDHGIHYFYATCNFANQAEAKGKPIFPTRVSYDGAQTFVSLRRKSIFPSRESHPWASKSIDWWAPEVSKVGSRYLALYSARKENGELAIGAALSRKPWGFKDIGRPFIDASEDDGRGVIDATYVPFLNAVSWKKDGNHAVMVEGDPTKVATPIFLQKIRVSENDVKRFGPIRTVMINDQDWEGDLVEGPSFWKHGDRTFCFYSANCYLDERYAMGYAYTDGDPLGENCKWTKHEGPFVSTASDFIQSADLAGPGHCMVYPLPNTTDIEMVFHAWPKAALPTAREKEGRVPFAVRLTFVDGMPQVVPGSLRAL